MNNTYCQDCGYELHYEPSAECLPPVCAHCGATDKPYDTTVSDSLIAVLVVIAVAAMCCRFC